MFGLAAGLSLELGEWQLRWTHELLRAHIELRQIVGARFARAGREFGGLAELERC
jgi:hypothetical protein